MKSGWENDSAASKYRAIVKQSGGWWIGWLLDLPGVNAQEIAQEKTRDAVIASLRLGAEEMLATQVPFEPDAAMTIVDVPVPSWLADAAAA